MMMMPGQERGERCTRWSGAGQWSEMEEGARERWSTAAGFPVNGERRPRAGVQSGQETTSRPRAHRSSPPLLRADLPSSSFSSSPSSSSSFFLFVAKGETAAAATYSPPATAPLLSGERTQRNNIFVSRSNDIDSIDRLSDEEGSFFQRSI